MCFVFSSHQPYATIAEKETSIDPGEVKKRTQLPPEGKINFPSSSLTRVAPGGTIRSKTLTPPSGTPVTFWLNCTCTFGTGGGIY